MDGTTQRLRDEQLFHDEQARKRRDAWRADPGSLKFDPSYYLDHEPWVRPAMALLGPLPGKHILDFGCGHGMAGVTLARNGAHVTAIDLSAEYVQEANARAVQNDVADRMFALTADGCRLPLANHSIDAVWGVAILHHLPTVDAAKELRRVLKPGGVAILCEPWGGNPLLKAARSWLPYPGKERTSDEAPLTSREVQLVKTVFPQVMVHPWQLFGMVRRAWKNFPMLATLDRCDRWVFRRIPHLRRWCRYVVLECRVE